MNPSARVYWTEEKLRARTEELRRHVARQTVVVTPVRYHSGDVPGAQAPDFPDAGWPIILEHQLWAGQPDQIGWFRAQVTVPDYLAGRRLALRVGRGIARGGHNNQAESLLYMNGVPYHGLDGNHTLVFLPPELCRNGSFAIAIQAWSGRAHYHELEWQDPELIWFDTDTDALAYDFDAVYRTVQTRGADSPQQVELLRLVEEAMAALNWLSPGSDAFYASVSQARGIMQAGLERLQGKELLKPTVTHIGHTHLDVAWLWTLGNIRLKTARSWASALRLMEQYPEFKWIQSQPQLYQYIKETQPEIWEQVKQRVAEGRWEADGGMWVEADCNLTGGESLVRQFMHGLRFFREELGVQNVVLWLPDVFGYAWALPQIIKQCGLKYFMTTKIAWSQFNRFPYDTFRWRGIDGTEVLTHFVTTPSPGQPKDRWYYTYNAEVLPETVQGNWDLYQQKDVNTETLSSFGWGDGGGGPTREMLEFARRLADMPGIPHVQISRVDEYFARLQQRVWDDPRLPVWNGELYLEYHRGTYTSQAQQKRKNRQAEFLLHNAELYAASSSALLGAAYPKSALDMAWEITLRNQFHDIIPGSSIPEVYAESAGEYERVFSLAGGALQEALQRLAAAVDLPEEAVVVFNPTGISRSDLVAVEGNLIYAEDVPANGYRAYPAPNVLESGGARPELIVTDRLLETPYLRIELNEHGQISRLYDRVNRREVLAPGRAANVLQAFEDKPLTYDAWDIDIYYQQKCTELTELVEAVVEETGPERGVLRLVWRYADSTLTQRLTVYARSPRIDFVTHVDWQQSQVLLKVAFPVEIHSHRATYEIQFGNVERPTHWNTTWDLAKFEVVGHKWADLSEGGYGVSLLNNCKYGHDIRDNVLRLTLIKSGIDPDPTADRGEHQFTYSLYPHAGDWYSGGTVAQAYGLNNPLLAVRQPAHPGTLPDSLSLVSCTAENVMIETVKQAESGDALVVRIYEFGNRRCAAAELLFCRPLDSAVQANLLETEAEPVHCIGNRLTFAIKPFEIKTFAVRFACVNI